MRALDQGLTRSIGVANFEPAHIAPLPTMPALNQCEMHPFLARTDLVTFCEQNGVVLQAHSNFAYRAAGKPKLLANELKCLARELAIGVDQLSLAFALSRSECVGIVPTCVLQWSSATDKIAGDRRTQIRAKLMEYQQAATMRRIDTTQMRRLDKGKANGCCTECRQWDVL